MTTPVSDKTVLDTTLTIIVDELELDVEPDEVDLDADLVEEYAADSLGLIQVLARVNKELSIRVPREDAGKLTTVRLLVDHVMRVRDAQERDR
jgi:acyl carrier protein